MIEIIPTNTCPPDLTELAVRSEAFAEFAPHVQLDIADGAFVPAVSWPYAEGQLAELEALAGKGLPLSEQVSYEVHIMAEEPEDVGKHLARANVERIIGHIEAFAHSGEALKALGAWKSEGAKEAGLALLLDTPLPVIEPLLHRCDVVQVMSIARLGYQGAPFEPRIYERIRELRALYPDLVIEVDGGVSEKNIAELVRAGATRFGVGSAISKAAHPRSAYEHLKKLAEDAVHPALS